MDSKLRDELDQFVQCNDEAARAQAEADEHRRRRDAHGSNVAKGLVAFGMRRGSAIVSSNGTMVGLRFANGTPYLAVREAAEPKPAETPCEPREPVTEAPGTPEATPEEVPPVLDPPPAPPDTLPEPPDSLKSWIQERVNKARAPKPEGV